MGVSKHETWYFAYLPYSIAFGILPVLIPLYFVGSLGGSLFNLGLMTSIALFFGIPASMFFGRLPERFGRTKPFILASFLLTGLLLIFLYETKSVIIFEILYILIIVADYLHPSSTSVLIAESYHKKSWGPAFAKYNFIAGAATVIGLAVCSIFITSIGYRTMLLICGPLVLISFFIAILLVEEPPIFIERWISRFERPIDEVSSLAYQLDGQKYQFGNRRRISIGESPRMLQVGLGFMAFSFAGNYAFTSFPVYLSQNASILPSTIFAIFLTRSVIGTFGYIIAGKLISGQNSDVAVKVATGMRILLALLLPTITLASFSLSPLIAAAILSLFAFSWSLYSIGRSTVIMEYAKEGTLGTYEALDGIGSMAGGLLGGAIPIIYGFNVLFFTSSVFFTFAFILFIRGLKH